VSCVTKSYYRPFLARFDNASGSTTAYSQICFPFVLQHQRISLKLLTVFLGQPSSPGPTHNTKRLAKIALLTVLYYVSQAPGFSGGWRCCAHPLAHNGRWATIEHRGCGVARAMEVLSKDGHDGPGPFTASVVRAGRCTRGAMASSAPAHSSTAVWPCPRPLQI
jgi:hypothetical protein